MRRSTTWPSWFGRVFHRIADPVLAVSLAAVGCLVGYLYHPVGWRPFDLTAYALICLVSLPLAVRRRFPVATLLVSNAAFAVYLACDYQPSVGFWGPVIALVTVATYRGRRTTVAAAILTGAVSYFAAAVVDELKWAIAVAQGVLVPVVAVSFGAWSRRLIERNARLAALTTQLHARQADRQRQAVVEDRVRIARELHDVIAHHMSVVSVQAGLARYVLGTDPATAGAALDTIGDTSREALAEMRRMLALLRIGPDEATEVVVDREPDGIRDPAPGLDRLDGLVKRVRAAGVPVTVTVRGRRRPLPPGVDLCAYRVVQESLTNVLKHAAPAHAEVTLDYSGDGFSVRITDDGSRPATQGSGPDATTGHGLTGMRERARLYDGTLTAGHRDSGGFEVALVLPASAVTAVVGQPTKIDQTLAKGRTGDGKRPAGDQGARG